MNSLKFWESWHRQYRILFYIFSSAFTLGLFYFILALIMGESLAIQWESFMLYDSFESPLATVNDFPFVLSVKSKNFLVTEWFGATDLVINQGLGYVYLAITWIGISTLIAISTALPRFWYYVTTGILVVVLMVYKFELLMLFGTINKTGLIIALLAYLPASYYFHAFQTSASLHRRIIAFLSISALFALLIYFFAEVKNPFYYLSSYGMPVPYLVLIIFILLVSNEIIAFFLKIVTSSSLVTSKKNWVHFYIISFFYLINLSLIYMKEIGAISFDLIPVNTFILLIFSAVIGFWGYRDKEPQYDYLMSFYPVGMIFYLTIGLMAFGSIGFFLSTANDSIVETVSDIILYSNIGYGLIFIMYISINFLNLLAENKPVYKVLYNPKSMPYFTFRLAGLIATLALVFYNEWRIPVNLSYSGYYNGLGDLYTLNEEYDLAEGYYKNGALHGYKDNRANYIMARLAEKNKDYKKALENYNNSIERRPTPYSYINLSNLYFNQREYFQALFTLQDGAEKFPEEKRILNNLGLLYAHGGILDSAFYFLDLSKKFGNELVANNNILGIIAKNDPVVHPDSVVYTYANPSPENQINRMAYYNRYLDDDTTTFLLEDTVLSQQALIHTSNFTVNRLYNPDTAFLSIIRKLSMQELNFTFKNTLDYSIALNHYYHGNVAKGITMMRALSGNASMGEEYLHLTMGIWYFEQGDYSMAAEYFRRSQTSRYPDMKLYQAMALTKSNQLMEAKIIWNELLEDSRPEVVELANLILKILHAKTLDNLADNEKTMYLDFKFDEISPSSRNQLIESISNVHYKAVVLSKIAARNLAIDQPAEAIQHINRALALPLTEPNLIQTLKMQKIITDNYLLGYDKILSDYNGLTGKNTVEKAFIRALKALKQKDFKTAESIMNNYYVTNPYFEDFGLLAARYYVDNNQLEKAYNTLQKNRALNKNSIRLNKEYVRVCGRIGYMNFGKEVLAYLKNKISEVEYEDLSEDLNKLYSEWEESLEY